MLTPTDFLHLPYTTDLTEGGIAYVLQSLAHEKILYNRMIRMVAGFAVELAFRRYLSQNDIPYETASSLPFAERDRHDVLLDGHRCDIKSFFISYRDQISKISREPQMLLNVPALVPSDVDAGEGHLDKDLYIFGFVTGLKAALRRDIETSQPHYFVHAMPEKWRSPAHWNPLGGLVLKSEARTNVQVEISGLDSTHNFISRTANLIPQKRTLLKENFYSISAIHLRGVPSARVGIRAETHNSPYIIAPDDWRNIWVHGMDILLAGYITRGQFRQRAKYIPPDTRVFQYNRTRVKNLAVPISSLKPLQNLFDRVRG